MPEIAGNESAVLCWLFCSLSLFVFATWDLWWWCFLDPAVDLLSATVDWTCYIVALNVVVSDFYHKTFIYIYTHLSLVCPLNKFIDIFLQFHYVIKVSSSVAKFGIICKFRHFADNIVSRSFIYIYIQVSGLIYYLVVHQMWLVPSCYRIGWCTPVGNDQLRSFGSIWLHHLECHVCSSQTQ